MSAEGRAANRCAFVGGAWVSTLKSKADEGPETIHLAAELASLAVDLDDVQRQTLTLLGAATLIALRSGDTRVALTSDGEASVASYLAPLFVGRESELAMHMRAVGEFIEAKRGAPIVGYGRVSDAALIVENGAVSIERAQRCELRLADAFRTRVARGEIREVAAVERALGDIVARPTVAPWGPVTLSLEQQHAVRSAALSRLCVISGGPGTGKTSIIIAILRTFARLGISPSEIAIAAPTGKAANRIERSVAAALNAIVAPTDADRSLRDAAPTAQTVHRLLGYSPARERYRYTADNRLPARVVIIDEASMVDTFMIDRVVQALPEDAALVLLGDADQLPSVDPGAVLSDLVAWGDAKRPGSVQVVRLTESYRMRAEEIGGGGILKAAYAVANGRALFEEGGALVSERVSVQELRFEGVELIENINDRAVEFVARWFAEKVRPDDVASLYEHTYRRNGAQFDEESERLLKHFFRKGMSARLLCPTWGGRTGAAAFNDRLHRLSSARAPRVWQSGGGTLCPGDPIVVVRNDYERGLFNGDQGVVAIVDAGDSAELECIFEVGEGKFVSFSIRGLASHIELAYATTIHKAQGSEFDCVAIVLPSGTSASREAVYTAMTRSRNSAVFLASRTSLELAVRQRSGRSTSLRDLLLE